MNIGKFCLVLFLLGFVFIARPSDAHDSNFFKIRGGGINLDHVTRIDSQIDYLITFPWDEEILEEYGDVVSEEGIEGVIQWLDPEELEAIDYYYIAVEASISLDDFKVNMLDGSFLKLPIQTASDIGRLPEVVSEYPSFPEFARRVARRFGVNKNKDGDTAYEFSEKYTLEDAVNALIPKQDELNESDYKVLESNLKRTLKKLEEAVGK